jgi:transcriptional regulator with XRE-family HTH domain
MTDHFHELRASPEYAEERLVAEVQSELQRLLEESGYNRTDLAKKMGVSKARVSQLFSDNHNFTSRLIARAFHALGAQAMIRARHPVQHKSLDVEDMWSVTLEALSAPQTANLRAKAVSMDVIRKALTEAEIQAPHEDIGSEAFNVRVDDEWADYSNVLPFKKAA